MAERTVTNEYLLTQALEGLAVDMNRAGRSWQSLSLSEVADPLKALQRQREMAMTGWKQLPPMFEGISTLTIEPDIFDVRLIAGKKSSNVEIERRDPEMDLIDETVRPDVREVVRFFESKNQLENSRTSLAVKSTLAASIGTNRVVELMQFGCPNVKPERMYGTNPAEYIDTDPAGSSFEVGGRDDRLAKLIADLRKKGFDTRLRLIIGDTDERDYIFPVIGLPQGYDGVVAEVRQEAFRTNMETRIQTKRPEWQMDDGNWLFSVERISKIEDITRGMPSPVALDTETTKRDLDLEIEQMRLLFAKGSYYQGAINATDAQLRAIVEMKFQTYADQGYRLKQRYPYAILLQNEYPQDQRTRILNLGNAQYNQGELGVVYPYA